MEDYRNEVVILIVFHSPRGSHYICILSEIIFGCRASEECASPPPSAQGLSPTIRAHNRIIYISNLSTFINFLETWDTQPKKLGYSE